MARVAPQQRGLLTVPFSEGMFPAAASRGVHKPTQGLQVRPAALGFFLASSESDPCIDAARVARKLVQDRDLVEVRYYIGRVGRSGGRAYEANCALIEVRQAAPGVVLRLGYIISPAFALFGCLVRCFKISRR